MDLSIPLTEIEKAELLEACRRVLKPAGVLLLRRVLFQLDRSALPASVEGREQALKDRPDLNDVLIWAENHVSAMKAANIASWHQLRAEMIRDGLKKALQEAGAAALPPVTTMSGTHSEYLQHVLHAQSSVVQEAGAAPASAETWTCNNCGRPVRIVSGAEVFDCIACGGGNFTKVKA